jgi:hypothetical protein
MREDLRRVLIFLCRILGSVIPQVPTQHALPLPAERKVFLPLVIVKEMLEICIKENDLPDFLTGQLIQLICPMDERTNNPFTLSRYCLISPAKFSISDNTCSYQNDHSLKFLYNIVRNHQIKGLFMDLGIYLKTTRVPVIRTILKQEYHCNKVTKINILKDCPPLVPLPYAAPVPVPNPIPQIIIKQLLQSQKPLPISELPSSMKNIPAPSLAVSSTSQTYSAKVTAETSKVPFTYKDGRMYTVKTCRSFKHCIPVPQKKKTKLILPRLQDPTVRKRTTPIKPGSIRKPVNYPTAPRKEFPVAKNKIPSIVLEKIIDTSDEDEPEIPEEDVDDLLKTDDNLPEIPEDEVDELLKDDDDEENMKQDNVDDDDDTELIQDPDEIVALPMEVDNDNKMEEKESETAVMEARECLGASESPVLKTVKARECFEESEFPVKKILEDSKCPVESKKESTESNADITETALTAKITDLTNHTKDEIPVSGDSPSTDKGLDLLKEAMKEINGSLGDTNFL